MLGVSYEFSKYNVYSIEYHMRFFNHAESNGINMDCFVNLFCFNTICNPYWRVYIIVHSETDFSAELNILYAFDIRFLRKTMVYKKNTQAVLFEYPRGHNGWNELSGIFTFVPFYVTYVFEILTG